MAATNTVSRKDHNPRADKKRWEREALKAQQEKAKQAETDMGVMAAAAAIQKKKAEEDVKTDN